MCEWLQGTAILRHSTFPNNYINVWCLYTTVCRMPLSSSCTILHILISLNTLPQDPAVVMHPEWARLGYGDAQDGWLWVEKELS
jgi:hypothetical protein